MYFSGTIPNMAPFFAPLGPVHKKPTRIAHLQWDAPRQKQKRSHKQKNPMKYRQEKQAPKLNKSATPLSSARAISSSMAACSCTSVQKVSLLEVFRILQVWIG